MGKAVYNPIMNRWLNSYSLDEYNESAAFREGYDDPTYMTFRIEFGDWGASVLERSEILQGTTSFVAAKNNYDALPIGLLNCPYPGISDGDTYWQNNADGDSTVFNSIKDYSAFRYLRQRNEDTRAKYLYYFVNGLFEIQKKNPYIFKKISGLNALEKFDPKVGQRLANDTKITVECFEGLNLKIRTLMEFYRKAAWDDVYQRWILPENMRQFKMIIYVFERRTFHNVNLYKDNNGKQQSLMRYGDLNSDIPVKAYECCPCEFDIAGSMSWNDSYSGSTENQEETSKLVINVKNVKTYYKNGLLNTTLNTEYNSNNTADINQKVSDLMIYDLVESIERSNSEDLNISTYTGGGYTGSVTVNGMRALFLNKDILMQNEDANNMLKYYVWGQSMGGTFYNPGEYGENASAFNENIEKAQCKAEDLLYQGGMNYSYRPNGIVSCAIDDPLMAILNIYDPCPRSGWITVLVNSPAYDATQSFWANLGNMAHEIMHGARRQVLLSGSGFSLTMDSWTNMMNCLYGGDPYVSYAIDAPGSIQHMIFENSNVNRRKTIQQEPFSDVSIVHAPFEELEPLRTVNDYPFEILSDPRTPDPQFYEKLEPLRDMPDYEYSMLKDPRLNPDYEYDELEPLRKIPEYEYEQLEDPRLMPDYDFNELGLLRDIPDYDFDELEALREIPGQIYDSLEPLRDIPDYDYNTLNSVRDIPDYDFDELNALRDIPEYDYAELEKTRIIPEQKMSEMIDTQNKNKQTYVQLSDLRNMPEYDYNTLNDVRDTSFEMTKTSLGDLRELPVFNTMSLEDLRKIPEQDMKELKEQLDNIKPVYKINNLKAIETLSKATEKTDKIIIGLDKDNILEEKAIIDTLKMQFANFKINDNENDTDETKRKKSLLKFAQILSDNSDDIKSAIADNIIRLKNVLLSLSTDSLNKLPEMNMLKLKKNDNNEMKHDNISMASLNDIQQIDKNIQILSLSNDEIKKLSLQTLIRLNKEIEQRVKSTSEMKGLSKLVDDNSKEEEQKKKEKLTKIYNSHQKHEKHEMLGLLPPREVNRNQIIM